MQERGPTSESSNFTSSDRVSHVFSELLPSPLPFSRPSAPLPLCCLFFSHRFLPSLPFITSIPHWRKKKNEFLLREVDLVKLNEIWFLTLIDSPRLWWSRRTATLNKPSIELKFSLPAKSMGEDLSERVCAASALSGWCFSFSGFLRLDVGVFFFFPSPGKFSASPLRTLASWPFFKLSPSVFLVHFEKVHLPPYLCLGLNCAFFGGFFFSPAY